MGVTRRMQHFNDPGLQIWFVIAAFGAVLIAGGIACMAMQFFVSIRDRKDNMDLTGDPWNARTLEWATSSPPPDYNFAFTPVVHDSDAWWDMKRSGYQRPQEGFADIHMPKNTAAGVILAGISVAFGFAMIWHIWWLAAISFVGMLAVAIGHTFNYDRDYFIPASEVVETEEARTRALVAAQA